VEKQVSRKGAKEDAKAQRRKTDYDTTPVSLLRNIPPAVLSTLSLTGLAAFVNVAALAGDFDATRPV